MKIHITHDELTAAAKKCEEFAAYGITGYSDIVEDLGVCAEVGGIYDEYWYTEAIWDAEEYVRKEYSYEADMLAMSDDALRALLKDVGEEIDAQNDGVHTLAATLALSDEKEWARLVEAVRDADTETLEPHFPGLMKELEDARDATERDMRRDFVRGDYHGNFEGIEHRLAKQLGAESVNVDDDDFTVEYDDDELRERLRDNYGRADMRLAKRYILTDLIYTARAYVRKEREGREKRRAEAERVRKYQEERAAIEKAERLAKLDAIRA